MHTTAADDVRAELAAAGFSRRAVTVRMSSGGSTVIVTVRSGAVSRSQVEALAVRHEHVRRDQWGEILLGGNTFVEVRYAPEAYAAALAEVAPRVALAAGLSDRGVFVEILEGWRVVVENNGRIAAWMPACGGFAFECSTVECMTRMLAERITDSRAQVASIFSAIAANAVAA